MSKRNTILALIAAGLLTVVALTPAFAVGLECSDYPNLRDAQSMGSMEIRGRPRPIKCRPCTSGMPRLTKATIITTRANLGGL